MQPVNRNVAGIDVHKRMLAVVVRREQNGKTEYQKRKFGTMRSEIEHLAAWLQHQQVSEVVMESTAQYWRPVWYGLEGQFQLHLCHPLRVRAPRGRKRDYRDAQRLADRWVAGDLEDSFIPGAEQRAWRALTRTRVHLKRKIGVIRSQVEGLLEQGSIKLTSVGSDVFGVSGWAMLERIARGETDISVLVEEARGALRKKESELKEALAGRLDPVYRLLLKQHMDQVELLRRQVVEINEALAEAMKAYVPTLVRLTKIPGVDLYAAQELVAEIGPTAEVFPTGLSGQPGIGGGLLQPSFGQREPLSAAFAVSDCLGSHSYQGYILRRSVRPFEAESGRQRSSMGGGPPHRQGGLAIAAQRGRISRKGASAR